MTSDSYRPSICIKKWQTEEIDIKLPFVTTILHNNVGGEACHLYNNINKWLLFEFYCFCVNWWVLILTLLCYDTKETWSRVNSGQKMSQVSLEYDLESDISSPNKAIPETLWTQFHAIISKFLCLLSPLSKYYMQRSEHKSIWTHNII